MHRCTTKLVAPAVLALALLSCSDDDDDATEGTAAPATSVDATPTTAAATTTDSPSTTEGDTTTTDGATSTTDGATSTTDGATSTTDDDSSTSLDVDERLEDASEALERGDFTTMLRILELSGLAEEIEDRAVTILAPTDEAFTALGADEVAELLTDPSRIDDVLRRHVLEGAMTYDELREATSVTTIDGEELTVTTEGDTVLVEGAEVTEPATTDDGQSGEQGVVVFGIDRVLVET